MNYTLKLIELEEEIERLKIEKPPPSGYTDLKKREKELEDFARKIVDMDLKEPDRYSFLERVEEYKKNIELYRESINSNKEKTGGLRRAFTTAVIGTLCFGLGFKFEDFKEWYKNRKTTEENQRLERAADYILQRLADENTLKKILDTDSQEVMN